MRIGVDLGGTNIEAVALDACAAFARDVLAPAVYAWPVPLAAAVHQCSEPISRAEAAARSYAPVEPGLRWGPRWSTAWFRLTGRVPDAFAGHTVALRFSSGTEALLWTDGAPRHGFDANHDVAVLHERAAGGETVDVYVEAACNGPLGVSTFRWDSAETHARWQEEDPGRLERCELVVIRPGPWRLLHAYEFARRLLAALPPDAPRARRLMCTLDEAARRFGAGPESARALDGDRIDATAHETAAMIDAALTRDGAEPASTCYAVGHGHIDTAWLWPIRETRRKCLRTFATALALMERYPDFRFMASQPQQYAWVAEDAPALFERIRRRVAEGRWEPAGAMWVESDCNIPSGESLIRQIIHGMRYWREAFGDDAPPQRMVYLPDTFGFLPALPQIMTLAGLDTFITCKPAWNETNEFPYVTFRWRGLDGSEVLAHRLPSLEYNCAVTPEELRRGEANLARLDRAGTGLWLQPFGWGDGGGGPTAEMVETLRRATGCDGLPEVDFGGANRFCDALHERRADLQAAGRDLPVWDGEIYLEKHRGTYTTQGRLKRANRRAESRLRIAEWLGAAGPAPRATPEATRRDLDRAWKLVLLDQFHDILPGTSIAEVNAEALRHLEIVAHTCDSLIDEGVRTWSNSAAAAGLGAPVLVFNPASRARSAIVESGDRLLYAADVPALGVRVIDAAVEPTVEPARIDGRVLSNGLITVEIDDAGRIGRLVDMRTMREAGALLPDGSRAPLNQLVLYDDRPREWDAWDIDKVYEDSAQPVTGPVESWRVTDEGPLRVAIEAARPLGAASRITQRYVLDAGSPCVKIRTWVDWNERHRLLRTLFRTDVRARTGTCGVPFGHVARPTHRNTTWDAAMFEVCGHGWMDLSEPGLGVSVLDDCKYGRSFRDNVMGLSLLRGPTFPDPDADVGNHGFAYAVMIHEGDWRRAGVDREAEALSAPFFAVPLPADQAGAIRERWAPFDLDVRGAASVEIVAVKQGEDDPDVVLIVRLVEVHGGRGDVTIRWNLPVEDVVDVDLLERPRIEDACTHDTITHDKGVRCTRLPLRPFQIVTLAARLSIPD